MSATATLTIDILDYCNMGCKYCRVTPGSTAMGFDQFKEIVDSHPDISHVSPSGGEPLLHPSFEEIVQYLLDNDKIVCVSTNLWQEVEKLERFYGTPGDRFTLQVSLPASESELYRKITGQDAFDAVMQNLQNVKPHLGTLINSVIYQENAADAENLIELAHKQGVPIRINLGYPVGHAKELEIVSLEQLQQLAKTIMAKRVDGRKIISDIGFTDASCSEVRVPCNLNAHFFGVPLDPVCPYEGPGLYYDAQGRQFRCEMEA